MFGRLRPPSSSPGSLELERSHSKMFKDDSLSIYEATLMKLKRGSQLATAYYTSPLEDPMEAEIDCISTTSSHDSNSSTQPLTTVAAAAANSSSSLISSASTVCLSANHSKHQPSVLDLFSKYKVSRHESISSQKDATMTTTQDSSESGIDSQSSLSFQSVDSCRGQSEHLN